LDRAPFGAIVASTRTDGRCLYLNPEFTRLTGYTLADIPTTTDWIARAYPDPAYRSQVLANWPSDVDPANMGRDVRYEVACKDGGRRRISFKASSLGAGLMLVTLHDVTSEHEMRQALLAGERRYRQVSEAITDLAYCFKVVPDGSLELDWLAGGLEHLLGRPPTGPPRLENWLRLILPEDLPAVQEASRAVLTGEPQSLEYRIRNAKGEILWLRDYSRPVRDPNSGRIVEVYGAIQDITATKRAEQETLRLQRQVAQAQKLESLGLLAGGVAHDFNNLLQGVLGNADLLAQWAEPGSVVAERVEDIRVAARRAADLARQLLSYAGRQQLAIEPLDLRRVIQRNRRLLNTAVAAKVSLAVTIEPDLPGARGDATQLCQVLMNLLANASDSLRGRSGTIRLRAHRVRSSELEPALAAVGAEVVPGDYACLEVSDRGHGIGREDALRMFDPFFSTKSHAGRGLGLAASAGIVRAHRGILRVHSEINEGTTVEVLLPAEPDTRGITQPVAGPPPERHFDGQHALLVDDDRLARRVGRAMLERLGFVVDECSAGRQGLARLREPSQRYTVVLLDLAMPDMDGGEVLATLRGDGLEVPVLVVSGYGEQIATGSFGEARGATRFLHKPFSLAELSVALVELLEV